MSEALLKDDRDGIDYTLHKDADCVWIRINNIAVYLRRQDEGVAVSLYPTGREMDEELAGTWALYTEAEDDEDYHPLRT